MIKITFAQLAAVLVIILVVIAWLFRYTLVPANSDGTYALVYKIDRWTGNVEVIQGAIYVEVSRRKDDSIK